MNPIPRKVKTIIESCRLVFNERYPQKFIDKLHKALKQLVEDGVLKDWNYLLDGKFDGKGKLISGKFTKEQEDLGLSPRKFWGDYIQKTLWLEPNSDIPRTKRKGDDPKPVISSPPPPSLSS